MRSARSIGTPLSGLFNGLLLNIARVLWKHRSVIPVFSNQILRRCHSIGAYNERRMKRFNRLNQRLWRAKEKIYHIREQPNRGRKTRVGPPPPNCPLIIPRKPPPIPCPPGRAPITAKPPFVVEAVAVEIKIIIIGIVNQALFNDLHGIESHLGSVGDITLIFRNKNTWIRFSPLI